MKRKEVKLLRITTVPISLKLLLTDQMMYMAENGLQVTMMSADGSEIKDAVNNEGCEHVVINLTRKISPVQDLKSLLKVFLFLKSNSYDIVHTHTPKAGLIGMLASKFARVPLRIHTIAGLPMMTMHGFKKRIMVFTEKLTAWGAHKVLPNSNSIFEFVLKNNLIPPTKLHVIGKGSTNGIDLNRFSVENLAPEKIEAYRKKYNPNGKKIILAVGRIVKDKGINELVEAFVMTSKKEADLHLLLLGPLEKERESENLRESTIEELRNNKNITHVNWSDEVEYFMTISNVLVHASHREGFPNVLLQAGALNLPIICSNIPGNIDIITSENFGQIFPVKDIKSLTDRLLAHVNDNEEAISKANKLKSFISNNFDRKAVHEQILNYYKTQLSQDV